MKITFVNRETYLQWRAEWRAEYARLSNEIRDIKFARWYLTSLAKKSEAQTARYKAVEAAHPGKYGFYPQAVLIGLKLTAQEMMEVRKQSKITAQAQYLAAKEQAKAA